MSEGNEKPGSGRLRLPGPVSRALSSEESRDLLLSVLLLLIAFLALAPGVLRYGLTWDEPTYFQFARLQRDWVGDLFGAVIHPARFDSLLAEKSIARVWLQHREFNGHPPLNELWMGLVGAPFHWLGAADLPAFRRAICLLFAVTSLLLFRLLRLGLSRIAALAGVLAYWGMPAIWAHAHLGATETMQNFFWVLQALLFPWVVRRGRRSLVIWLLVAACSFMAKFTNLLIPVWVLGTAFLFGLFDRRRFWLCAILSAVIGPLLLVWLDPFFWPWQGGWARFLDYLGQTMTRSQWVPISVFYMGRNWGFHPPWHYRLVETASALPLCLLLLLPAGLWFSLRAALRSCPSGWRLLRSSSRATLAADGPDQPERSSDLEQAWPQVLGLTGLLLTLAVGWLPRTPNHDGTRQFAYVFPSLALLVATGVDGLIAAARSARRPALDRLFARWRSAFTALLLALVTIAFGISLAAEPWGLSYFSEWLGGIKGAWDHGYEVSYWCESITPRMLARLRMIRPREPGVLRVQTLPKLSYFTSAKDLLSPFLPPDPGRPTPVTEDVMSAFYAGFAKAMRHESRGPILALSFSTPPDAILISYRRATINPSMWDFFEFLANQGDLTLLDETKVGGVVLARLYAVNDLEEVRLPEDPKGITWYQPPTVVEMGRRTEGAAP